MTVKNKYVETRSWGQNKDTYSIELLTSVIADIVRYRQMGWSQEDIDFAIKKEYGVNNPIEMRKYASFLDKMGCINVIVDKKSTLDIIAKARQNQLINQKIITKQKYELHHQANVDAWKQLILDTLRDYPYQRYPKAPKVAKKHLKMLNKGIIVVADEHYKGEMDLKHLNMLYDSIEYDIISNGWDIAEIWFLGDSIDGLIHTGSLSSNDGAIQPAIQYCNVLIERINQIKQIKAVKFVNKSNHTQTRALGTNRNELAREDLSLMMSEMIKIGLRKDIDFVADDIIRFKEQRFNVALLHGHQPYAKSKSKMLEYWNSKYDLVPDLTIMGHYHTFKVNEYGNNKWLVVAPTAKQFNGDYEESQGYISNNQYLLLSFVDNIPQFTIRRIKYEETSNTH